ncbi:MAG: hypothetical protein LBG64_00935 [Pseudomonadales bacterium]|jgi:arabinogalactan endo-1,4-beta-galactosidase|nr:hypothetical protein [Pseudomonadales bacterium]
MDFIWLCLGVLAYCEKWYSVHDDFIKAVRENNNVVSIEIHLTAGEITIYGDVVQTLTRPP